MKQVGARVVVRARLVPEPVHAAQNGCTRNRQPTPRLLHAHSSSLSLAHARCFSLSWDAMQISKPLSKQIVVYAKTHPTFSSGVRSFGQIINRMTGTYPCVCRTQCEKLARRKPALSGPLCLDDCLSPPLLSQSGHTVLQMGRAPTESRRNSVRLWPASLSPPRAVPCTCCHTRVHSNPLVGIGAISRALACKQKGTHMLSFR